MILIFTTLHKKSEAHKIGKDLLIKKLIACYNLIPIQSAYWWEGKIEKAKEFLLILKTSDKNFKKIEYSIKKLSNYEIPEIVAVEPSKVSESYLNWIDTEIEGN